MRQIRPDPRLAFRVVARDSRLEIQGGWPMADHKKLAFVASDAPIAQQARAALSKQYDGVALEDADIIVALGGDGFMLETLHGTQHLPASVYGMNRGTVGFLMNSYSAQGLRDRLAKAEEEVLNPLHMAAAIGAVSRH